VIEAHQKFLAGKGNERLMKYVDHEFGKPENFADFVYLSQVAQAEGIELAALHHRASRPYTMGSLYWQLNDVWPGASWSGIDWFGRWKALQYHARRFFAPVTVAALRNAEGNTTVSLLNDRATLREGELRLRVMDLAGKVMREERKTVTLAPLASTKLADYTDAGLLDGADAASTIAVFDLSVEDEPLARDIVWFKPAKDIAWPDPGVRATLRKDGDGAVLDLGAQRVARAVWIDFGDLDAEISDNALTLLPGESMALRVESGADVEALRAALHVRSLDDALEGKR
jgi:beta-mannosidase